MCDRLHVTAVLVKKKKSELCFAGNKIVEHTLCNARYYSKQAQNNLTDILVTVHIIGS